MDGQADNQVRGVLVLICHSRFGVVQLPAVELRQVLVNIWARILAFDLSLQVSFINKIRIRRTIFIASNAISIMFSFQASLNLCRYISKPFPACCHPICCAIAGGSCEGANAQLCVQLPAAYAVGRHALAPARVGRLCVDFRHGRVSTWARDLSISEVARGVLESFGPTGGETHAISSKVWLSSGVTISSPLVPLLCSSQLLAAPVYCAGAQYLPPVKSRRSPTKRLSGYGGGDCGACTSPSCTLYSEYWVSCAVPHGSGWSLPGHGARWRTPASSGCKSATVALLLPCEAMLEAQGCSRCMCAISRTRYFVGVSP